MPSNPFEFCILGLREWINDHWTLLCSYVWRSENHAPRSKVPSGLLFAQEHMLAQSWDHLPSNHKMIYSIWAAALALVSVGLHCRMVSG